MLKTIRKQLLKVDRIKQVVTKSLERKKWAKTMLDGGHVRMPEKSDCVLTIQYEDGLLVDYMDGRVIGHRGVVPFVMRPFGMWRWRD